VRSVVLKETVCVPFTWLAYPVEAFNVVRESFATVNVWHSSQVNLYVPEPAVLSVCFWCRVDKVVALPAPSWQPAQERVVATQ
jgi:hypothetical protein